MDYRIEQLRHQLREDPSSRVFYQLGELLRRNGEVDESVEVLRSGIEHHPRYVAAWVSLGRGLLQREDWSGAEVAFARALEYDPENAVAARMIGEAATGRGDLVRAVKALKLARALSPRDPSLEEQIAAVEARLGERGLLEQAAPKPPPAIAPHHLEPPPSEPDEPAPSSVAEPQPPPAEPEDTETPPGVETAPVADEPQEAAPEPSFVEPEEPEPEPTPAEPEEPAPSPVGAQYNAPPPAAPLAAEEPESTPAADAEEEPPEAGPEPEPPTAPIRTRQALETQPLAVMAPEIEEEPEPEQPEEPEPSPVWAQYIAPPPAAEPAAGEPEPSPAFPPEPEPLEVSEPAPVLTEELPFSLPAREPAPVSTGSSEEDPFALAPRTESGVLHFGGDVFGATEPEPEPEPPTFADEIVARPPVEPAAELAPSEEPEEEPTTRVTEPEPVSFEGFEELPSEVPAAEPAPTPSPVTPLQPPWAPEGLLVEPEELPEELPEEPEPEGVPELPAPSLTLARLALAQGDRELAERTLEGVLERDPDAVEAAELLNALRSEGAGAPGDGLRAARRIAALQGWLERFRLAAERLQA